MSVNQANWCLTMRQGISKEIQVQSTNNALSRWRCYVAVLLAISSITGTAKWRCMMLYINSMEKSVFRTKLKCHRSRHMIASKLMYLISFNSARNRKNCETIKKFLRAKKIYDLSSQSTLHTLFLIFFLTNFLTH